MDRRTLLFLLMAGKVDIAPVGLSQKPANLLIGPWTSGVKICLTTPDMTHRCGAHSKCDLKMRFKNNLGYLVVRGIIRAREAAERQGLACAATKKTEIELQVMFARSNYADIDND